MTARRKKPGKQSDWSDDERRNIRLAVRELWRRCGENASRLAEVVGTSQPTASDWNNGNVTPGLWAVKRIAELLGTTEYAVRLGLTQLANGPDPGAIEAAIRYYPARWRADVIRRGREEAASGEHLDPQGWTKRLDELNEQMTGKRPRG